MDSSLIFFATQDPAVGERLGFIDGECEQLGRFHQELVPHALPMVFVATTTLFGAIRMSLALDR